MRNNILVSVLINNYNYGLFLSEAIESVLCQTYSNIEIIVVDDGSTDNSRNIISKYANKVIPIFKENGGQATAFNAGFSNCSGDVLLFLDSDDVFEPNKVMTVIDLLDQYRDFGWVFHELGYVNSALKPFIIPKNSNHKQLRSIDARSAIARGQKIQNIDYATSALCFKRKILSNILPMPDSLRINSDIFLYFAAFLLSPGLYYPEKLALQRIHGSNSYTFQPGREYFGTVMEIKTNYHLRERFKNWAKYGDMLFACSLGRLIGMAGVRKAFQIAEVTKYWEYFFSTREFVKHLPRILYNILKWRAIAINKRHGGCL